MRKKQKKLITNSCSLLLAAVLAAAFASGAQAAPQMNDYCSVPSYVVQNVSPNIMILLDNSGSFYNYAYRDTGNDCSSSASPCTQFNPSTSYYGYFDSNAWYQYSSSRFIPDPANPVNPTIGSSITNPNSSSDWDGNFLNWLTMREMDVSRKALTGGLCDGGKGCGKNGGTDGSGYDRLVGLGLDSTIRGAWKQVSEPGDYTPYSSSNTRFQSVVTSSYGQFIVQQNNGNGWGNVQTFGVKVRVPVGVEGVLQKVVGARARVGLATFGSPWNEPPNGNGNGDGAQVVVNVSGQSLSSIINQINNTQPTSNTPLAEALFEVAGYFGQVSNYFNQLPSPGPGPNFTGGKYSVNSNDDPYNYGSGGQTQYPKCSQNFVLLVTDGEPCEDGEIPSSILSYAAQRSPFICTNTGDLSNGTLTGSCPAVCSDGSAPAGGICPAGTILYPAEPSFESCSAGNTAAGLESVALWMHDGNPAGVGGTADDMRQDQPNNPGGINSISLYTVFAFGHGYSSTLLKYASINGGFVDNNGDYKPTPGDEQEWSTNGSGEPDNYFEASDGQDIENALTNALSAMLKRVSSGTAASVLASGQGSGANLVQAVFYPRRSFMNDVIDWTGSMQNLWYYIDPFFKNSSILEDTDQDKTLTLTDDDIAQLYFDQSKGRTMADRFLSKSDGTEGAEVTPPIYFEQLMDLWEAGLQLWSQDPSSRTIYTNVPGQNSASDNMMAFGTGINNTTAATLDPYLGTTGITNGATSVIQWTEGYDLPGYDPDNDGIDDYRDRTVSIIVNGGANENTNVWKLGDILNSTPRIVASVPLSNYDSVYNDTTYSQYINSSAYTSRGTVYVGGNDGMLHAFKLGTLTLLNDGNTKAQLTGSNLGVERWAFIPENVLPYLKYIADPNYCHIYSVDLTPYVFDASIGEPSDCTASNYWNCTREESSWRTILIGGMRQGGATSSSTSCCSTSNSTNCSDCVTTPVSVGGSPVGYSSYFALDVTDENNPRLLWEFTNPNLGFATSGPAIVRIDATTGTSPNFSPDVSKNGRWFVVFGSGPTGPMETTNHQMLGHSDQDLEYFVLDLATGQLVKTIDTGIQNAFSGDLFNATNDSGLLNGLPNYQDDSLYAGYVRDDGSKTWEQGGVERIVTAGANAKAYVDAQGNPDPTQWTYGQVIDGIGPVTASVARLQDNNTNKLWLYFGTGRYFYSDASLTPQVDDLSGQSSIFGVPDPCYQGNVTLFASSCPAPYIGTSSLGQVSTTSTAGTTNPNGWYINLDPAGNYTYPETVGDPSNNDTVNLTDTYGAERVITDPDSTVTGAVYFTTYKPYNEQCGVGGKSFLWVVNYSNGAALTGAMAPLGNALLQVSTGSIQQINLSTSLTSAGGRKTSAFEGMPPTAAGLSLLTSPPPVERLLHVREEK